MNQKQMITNKHALRNGGCISYTVHRELINFACSERLKWLITNYGLEKDCSLRLELNTSACLAEIGHPQPGERTQANNLSSSISPEYSYGQAIQAIKDDVDVFFSESKKADRLYIGMCIKLLLQLKEFQKYLQNSFYEETTDSFWYHSTHTYFLHGVVVDWIEKTESLMSCGDYCMPDRKFIRPFHCMWRKGQKEIVNLALDADKRGLRMMSVDELCGLNEVRQIMTSIISRTQ